MLESLNIRYNWQLKICKQDLDYADDKDISELVHLIRNKFTHTRSRRHEQMPLLEHQVHQVQNFEQLLEITHQSIEELKKFCKERNLIVWPSSVWQHRWNMGNLSVSLGVRYNPKEIFKIWNRLIPYLPGFIALMVNSPAMGMMAKEYKSYRLINSLWEGPPTMPTDEDSYQEFGEAGCLRVDFPYLMSKAADSASSPQLVCEYAALFGALAYALAIDKIGKNDRDTAYRAPTKFNRRLYEEYLINRKLAAIHGLQAVFQYDGKKREAVDLIWEIMEIAKPGLKKLGADIGDLKMINQMLQKRQTQADMALALLNRYNDLHPFYTAYANIISNFNAFEEYLASAPELKPCESPSIEDLVVSRTHLNSGYWFVQMVSGLPPVQFDRFMEKLKRERKIKTEKDVDRGLMFVKSNQPSAISHQLKPKTKNQK